MRRGQEGGFAMLLVLVMAAIVAISLYYSMPRVAFESQRDKEQTLIDRGEQYKRAIQLYVRQNKAWPAKIEDLESMNGKRYLRRRYLDPMTGKDEWRLVHVGPNGILTDSLIKPLNKKQGDTYSNNFITELGGVGAGPEAQGTNNPGMRKRASDQAPTGPGEGNASLPGDLSASGAAAQPGSASQSGQQGQANPPPGLAVPGQQAAAGGLPQQLQRPGTYPGPPVNSQTGGISVLGGVGGSYSTTPYSTTAGANGATQPPAQVALQGQQALGGVPGQLAQAGQQGATPASAAQLIQGILTTPRPGGLQGTAAGAPMGQVQGGGIAGFASKYEGQGIKRYNDQDEYQKWEFVYDMSKDAMITGGQNAIPQPAGPNTTPGGNGQPGQATTGFGNSSFGQTPAAGTPAPPATPPH